MAIMACSIDVEVMGTDDGCACERRVLPSGKTFRIRILTGFIRQPCESLREICKATGGRGVGGCGICVGQVCGGGG